MENEEKIEAETPVVEAEIAPEASVEAEEEKPVSIKEQPEITIETFGTRVCTCGQEVSLKDEPVACSCGVKHIK